MKAWSTPSLVCDHTQHEGGQSMVHVRYISLLFWKRGLGEAAVMTVLFPLGLHTFSFFPHITSIFFLYQM